MARKTSAPVLPAFDYRRFVADVTARAADQWEAEARRLAMSAITAPFYAFFKRSTDEAHGDVRFFVDDGYSDMPTSAVRALGWELARQEAFRGPDRAAAYRFIDAAIGGLPILSPNPDLR